MLLGSLPASLRVLRPLSTIFYAGARSAHKNKELALFGIR
jgi:hypothetical protein